MGGLEFFRSDVYSVLRKWKNILYKDSLYTVWWMFSKWQNRGNGQGAHHTDERI